MNERKLKLNFLIRRNSLIIALILFQANYIPQVNFITGMFLLFPNSSGSLLQFAFWQETVVLRSFDVHLWKQLLMSSFVTSIKELSLIIRSCPHFKISCLGKWNRLFSTNHARNTFKASFQSLCSPFIISKWKHLRFHYKADIKADSLNIGCSDW